MVDFTTDFEASLAGAFAALVKATKAAGRLPEDIGFYRTLDEDVDARLERVSGQVIQMAQQLQGGGCTSDDVEIVAVDDVAVQGSEGWAAGSAFRKAVDSVDTLLERIDAGLSGGRQTGAAERGAAITTTVRGAAVRMVHAANVARPQLEFADGVDNSPDTAFVWKIRTKPHARVPLDHGLPGREVADTALGRHLEGQGISRPGSPHSGGVAELPHPYEYEITNLQPAEQLFEARTAQIAEAWDNTPFAFVDTMEGLQGMLEHLESAEEIAVDLEHHDYRSYQGFTCLVQISTRQRDYVVDALALRSELWRLNDITADPQRVKVLHGAESDVVWLQRDFGVYLVGLFDTYHATKVLNMSHHSLAHLLRTYCGVDVDKKYQLADWRLRPLPTEMMAYARGDTHYLLNIFDCLRSELLERGKRLVGCNVGALESPHFGELCGMDVVRSAIQPMEEVIRRSSQTSLRRYTKEAYDDSGLGGWSRLLKKWRHPFSARNLAVFRGLHRWRDMCAREEDESTRYVLPNHMLFAIASNAPEDVPALLTLCQPTPPLVRMHAADIIKLIADEWLVADLRMRDVETLPTNVNSLSDVLPVHIRFDELSSKSTDELSTENDVLSEDLLASAIPLVSSVSNLFGTDFSEKQSTAKKQDLSSAKLASDIRSNLVLSVAVPATVVTAVSEPEFVKPSKRNVVPKIIDTPSIPSQPMVLSESMSKLNTDDSNISRIDIPEEEEERNHTVKRKRSKKKKSGKSSASPTVSPGTVKPFDYTATDAAEIIADSVPATPAKKQRRKGNRNFDPYSQINTKDLTSPPSRTRVNSKTSNRTISYKK
ncbi:exosome nuclease subunit [Coemansia sp. RSA 1365]|nr:exosome nuclease subunit [Coemansia sp. RSA 1365]